MSNLKKHSILIIMAMLILIMIPMSLAAADVEDNNATDVIGISEIDEVDVDLSSTDDSNTESASEDDVLSAGHDYETTPSPNTLNYVEGGDNTVTVTVSCDYTYTSAPMYVYINGDGVNDRQVVNGVYGNKASFTYDVSKISSHLKEGENILKFHIDESYLTEDWLSDFQYNPLTVIVGESSTEPYTGIIYVNETGDNNNDGSEESPVATIDKAIELATDGNHENKVIVNQGTYTLSNYAISKAVNVTGVGEVIIVPDGKKYHLDLSGANDFIFNNIIFANGGQTTYPATGSIYLRSTSSKLYLNGCTFLNNTGGYYAIVYVNGGQVTATGCNFINNTVTSASSAIFRLVSTSKADISYSNIINNKNTASGGFSFITGDSSSTISVENNYWGSNDGPNNDQINLMNYQPDKWVKLTAELNDTTVYQEDTYDLTLKFEANSGSLSQSMPDLDVNLIANGQIDESAATISNNQATVKYTAPQDDSDTLTVKINDDAVYTKDITIEQKIVPYTGAIYVNETGDDSNDGSEESPVATIAQAIVLATDGEHEAKIIITEGTYTEHDIIISTDLEIIGQGNAIIDANNEGRIFKITSGDVKLTDLTLTNGAAPKDVDGGYEQTYPYDPITLSAGGAIYVADGSVDINNLTFTSNTATDYAGAIYLKGDKSRIINSTFKANSANEGGAIYIINDYYCEGILIEGNEFESNVASNQGGAIAVVEDSNDANIIKNNTFTKNEAVNGGAIASDDGYVKVFNNTFDANTAEMGAAVISTGYINLNNNTMTDNVASISGNEIYNVGTITSYVTIVFLNGETVTVNDGKAVELTVKVTDDNGNSISGGDVTFTVNDEQTLNDPSDLVNGVSTVKFTPRQNGTLTVSGSYSGVYDDRFTLTEGYLNVSNAVPEYFGIIYVDSEGDDENDGDSNNPVKTLDQAIFLATREGGSNQIVIRQGTYKVTGYTFTDSINITGEGNPTLDAENNNAIFTLSGKENTNFVFTGLTFANGYAHMINWGDSENGGAISLKGGNLFLENDKFINNTATMGGGAIYIAQGPMDYDTYQNTPSTAKITGCEFENNGNGKNYGGAIYIYGAKASADITGSTFEKNTAGSGGAIYVSSSTVNITGCEFNNNNATADGGALYISASANIKNNEFTGNNATKYSSSMYLYKSSWGNNEIALEGNTIYSEDSEIYTNNLDIKGFVITILDGETQTFCEGDITLYATVHDDNYNKISSNSFTFVINTTKESTTLDNGEATLVYNAKLTDDGAVVTTTVVSSEDGAEVNPGKLEIVEYNIIFNFDDEIGHAGKTLTLYVTVEDAAGNIIKDNITVSFNNEEFEASINEDDEFEINLKMPETPQTLDLKLSYNGFNQTHTVEVVSYYDGVIYVSPSGDDDNNGSEDAPVKTIEQAIELASDKDNVAHKIIIAEGTYNENSLSIETPLEIIGQGKVIIDAQQEGRIFNIESDANISGITFKNGKEEDGAAIYISDGKVNIDNCIFQENTADNAGAAIFWDANDGKLTNTVFENNTARNGVVSLGVFSWSAGTTGKNTLVENCTFNNNHNTVYGNCIGLDVTGDDVVIKNTNFTNNKGESGSEHGALYIKGSNVEVDNCLFENNSMGMAAAIQIDGEDAVIKNSKFINNTVTNGLVTRSGAIELQGSAEITGCTFINNGGDDCVEGGAINVVCADYVGDILISNNEFINNSAKAGAAIFVDGGSEDYCQFDSLTIEGNTFKDNVADVGSAVYVENSEGPVTIQNNEIVTSEGDDNAIYVDEDTASDVTVGDNPVTYSTSINVTTNAPALGENATITVTISKGATGNVIIKVGDNIAETVKIVNGTAVLNVPNLGVGSYDVVVNYDGNENYTKAEASATLTVSKATPSADDVMDINVPAGTTSPTFSIKLPSDATGNLTVTVDGENYTASLTNGTASITVPNLASGNHNVTVSYSGDDKYGAISKNTTVSIPVIALTGNDVAMLYSSSAQYKVRVTADGKPVSGVVVTFKFNGKTLNVKTDANGYASYKIPVVKPKKAKYTIIATYNGITKTNKVKVNSIIKAANKKVKKSKKATKIKITLKKVNKKYLKKKTIKIKFKGKTYKVKTNKKGVATWKVKKSMLKKLKVGKKYKYKVTYGKDTVTKKLTIKK